MKIFERNSHEINPGNVNELNQLAEKWNITINELSYAIVETGSLNTKVLQSHISIIKNATNPLNRNRSFSVPLDFIP